MDAPASDLMRALVAVPLAARGRKKPGNEAAVHSPEDRLAETVGLAQAIDLTVAAALLVSLNTPRPGMLFGSGKVAELGAEAKRLGCGLVIIDHVVSPIQQRNLEVEWNVKVLDRTGLILEIFGRRARTREGRLQVDLAHLTYQKSRLVRSWTHLERQRGGAGFLGGPGETQLELDRRLIQDRIDRLKLELSSVVRTRDLHRQGRRKVPYPVVAIVGYTNAGKSTLFNRLTGATVLAADQVFATLDPTLREVRLKSGRRIILSDTVGFISDLPTLLVAAFRATLEEVIEADLVLHVRDISHPETDAQRRDVTTVLGELGVEAEPEVAGSHLLEVWNKIDRLEPQARVDMVNAAHWRVGGPQLVSAITGEGLVQLLAEIDARLGSADRIVTLDVPASEGRLVHWLHENAQVMSREARDNGDQLLTVRVPSDKLPRLRAEWKRAGLADARLSETALDGGGSAAGGPSGA